jgi:hypothetical protein
MAIKRSMLDLDGRILTLSVFLDHELPLLKQVADIQPAEESPRSPSYADFWLRRFVELAGSAHKAPGLASKSSRNVYSCEGDIFTSCRTCDTTAKGRGIWRSLENLDRFFLAPTFTKPRSLEGKDLTVRALISDYLFAFFPEIEQAQECHAQNDPTETK